MRRSPVMFVVGMLVAAAGCGGGEGAGEPLVSSSLAGVYADQAFTPAFGVATVYMTDNLIAIGDGPLNCGSAQRSVPPSGTNAVLYVPALDVGTYSDVFVDMIQSKGNNFAGYGSNGGTVTITAASATSVVGTVAYSATDSDTNKAYSIAGSFEVSRCPM